jgi:prephenate dehydrogenase
MRWRKATLIGVGLLGGSIGLALKRRGLASQVQGYVRHPERIAECLRAGAVDTASTDLLECVRGADLLIFCTPLSNMEPLARAMQPAVERGAVVTDVGSVKGTVVETLEPLFAATGARFIGSHPMAGSEKTGVSAARAELFERAVCVVTPTPRTDAEALAATEQLWASLGGRVLRLDPSRHDQLVSRTSHLPHFLAVQLARLVLGAGGAESCGPLCAGGFRDGTRVAAGSPEMWRDIALANRQELAGALEEFGRSLDVLRQALAAGDSAAIESILREARSLRSDWKEPGAQAPLE